MIRKADLSDLDQIWEINTSYFLDIAKLNNSDYVTLMQKQGLLLELETKTEFGSRINTDTLFSVYEQDEKILGFIDINKEIYFPKEADNIIWLKDGLREHYFDDPKSTVLHTIAVKRENMGKGIASQLLEYAVSELKKQQFKNLFSIIVFGSLTNCSSLLFHSKNGFRRACVSMPMDLFGIKNYQSLLFVKNL